jgi:hypothetical protein
MACNWHRGLIVKNGSNDKIVNSAPWRLIFHKLQTMSVELRAHRYHSDGILLPLMDVKDDNWKQWNSLVGIH